MKLVHTPPTFYVAMTTKEIQNAILLLLETHTTFESVSLHTLFLRKKLILFIFIIQVNKPQEMSQKSYKFGNGLSNNELFSAASSHLVDHKNSFKIGMVSWQQK